MPTSIRTGHRTITLTDDQIAMLQDAIDSHVYWQLSDEQHRSDGAVIQPGSDDEETAAAIAAFQALADDLSADHGGR